MQGALGKSSEEILDGYSLGNPFILLKLEVSSLNKKTRILPSLPYKDSVELMHPDIANIESDATIFVFDIKDVHLPLCYK
ncbi:hypothetical protein DI09_47p120 [Mitosporidium daphniae]|uniref:Uncharacterized protein n=1 Tax=Mitosporidium daphniae TaxID=1485682 RepID=A0A098VQE8_9MICR|nr:uncharacterized protein DI09_47p120 [Mitosporidium daphniae]KGG51034.1 hypothetical protein DI09_47p120 [Mitosporidium daphniae]|eukprot:XP_013237461.1 uncharacterized protein DI09_47p120 [Mitosporidium daphniae]